MATNIFVYWSDGLEGRAFDHHRRNGGAGYLSIKIAKNFSNARGMPGGMLAAGIVSYIKSSKYGGIECISETAEQGGRGYVSPPQYF